MASLFKGSIIGNLGGDVELKYAESGTAVAKFSVATTEKVKSQNGQWEDVTTWVRATAFGKLAENISKYLSKGSQVYLEGRVRLSEWEDRDGNKRSNLELTVSDIQFLSKANRDEDETDQLTKSKAKSALVENNNDVPF